MELTPELFNDFIARLRHHNTGAGTEKHCTADPIFIVESRRLVCGIDHAYGPDYFWTDNDGEARWSEEELAEQIAEARAEGLEIDPFDLQHDDEVTCDDGKRTLYEKIGYAEHWEFASAHLTQEAADAFVARKAHDYRGLRISVDSLYWCPEFKMIVRALLSGRLGLIEAPDKEQGA